MPIKAGSYNLYNHKLFIDHHTIRHRGYVIYNTEYNDITDNLLHDH